jgi:periplasmic divalent cation tolerance protein
VDDAGETVVVFSTAPSADEAERIARALLESRLVACASLVPGVTSLYRWQGAVQRDAEVLMVMKTRRGRVAELLRRLPALHPYEVPEAVVLPIEAGLPAYCRWVMQETEDEEADRDPAGPPRATEK